VEAGELGLDDLTVLAREELPVHDPVLERQGFHRDPSASKPERRAARPAAHRVFRGADADAMRALGRSLAGCCARVT
jgi:hypothetical protein